MNDEPNQIQPSEPPKKKSPALALVIGFLPAFVLLALITIGNTDFGKSSGIRDSTFLIWPICFFSIACSFISSFLLFRRKNALAIIGGIFFLLLNGFMAFFLGCAALIGPF